MNIIGDEEWASMRKSTTNSHFTSPEVVTAFWKMAQRLGFGSFNGGRFLEPSAGIGYYLGMMPPEIAARTRISAVEKETITGRMLKLLYPAAKVDVDMFENHLAPDDFYDLIASNVPFGNFSPQDTSGRYQRVSSIHDYFFLKSADLVRPGGLVMHITSTGTMDKDKEKVRQELASKFDLVSAVRFPGGTHQANAGTEVVTDMLILRKKEPGDTASGPSWSGLKEVPDPDGGEPIVVNEYFADHPEQILGRLDRSGSMYAGDSVNVSQTDDYEKRLADAIERLPEGILKPVKTSKAAFEPSRLPAPGEVKDGGFFIKDGKLYIREGGAIVEQPDVSTKDYQRIRGQLEVRDAYREVVNVQANGQNADAARKKLNEVYDRFVVRFGFLNDRVNSRPMRTDPDAPNLLALEVWDAKKETATKFDTFYKDTVSSHKPVTKADTAQDALGVSMHERGYVDIDHMVKITGRTKEQIHKELRDKRLAFEDPSQGWKPRFQYLTGNVRRKLAMARAAAAVDPRFQSNVDELEKVQPQDIDHTHIKVKMGAPWVPASDIAAFAAHLLEADPSHFETSHISSTGEWLFDYSKEVPTRSATRRTQRKFGALPKCPSII